MRNAQNVAFIQFAYKAGPEKLAQADLNLRCPLTESMDSVVYVDEQKHSRSDCINAHAHLDICCWHEPFSHVEHQLLFCSSII